MSEPSAAVSELMLRATARPGRNGADRDRRARRVVHLLAQGHDLSDRPEAGAFDDYAGIAHQHALIRARIAQIMNLLLTPDLQAELLPPSREPETECQNRRRRLQ